MFAGRLTLLTGSIKMDGFSALFDQISLSAREVFSGGLCNGSIFDDSLGLGVLHLIRGGNATVILPNKKQLLIDQPTLLFFPRPCKHSFECADDSGVELTCALIEFAGGMINPLSSALPDFLAIPLSSSPVIDRAVTILFDEAFSRRNGRQAAMDRVFEYVVILLLRHLIETKSLNSGMLAGLSDEKLAKAITLIHECPAVSFTLLDLAEAAGMSRARFASHFCKTVGATPIDYLTDWRISIATAMIRKGMPINQVAQAVGYTNSAAFTRVFAKKVGASPRAWLKRSQLKGEIPAT
jgi:AraC-like DNA-binding protein